MKWRKGGSYAYFSIYFTFCYVFNRSSLRGRLFRISGNRKSHWIFCIMDWNDVFVYAAGIAVCGDSDYRYCFYCLEFQDVMGKDIGI